MGMWVVLQAMCTWVWQVCPHTRSPCPVLGELCAVTARGWAALGLVSPCHCSGCPHRAPQGHHAVLCCPAHISPQILLH